MVIIPLLIAFSIICMGSKDYPKHVKTPIRTVMFKRAFVYFTLVSQK